MAFPCPLNGLAHFVPNARLSEVTAHLSQMESDFWEAKQRFLQQYGQLRHQASTEWRTVAEKLVAHPDELVAAIESSFPLRQKMDRFFSFETQLFQISVPERLGVDLITMVEQREVMSAREKAARDAASKICADVETFVSDS